jgi:feruloyl esterase
MKTAVPLVAILLVVAGTARAAATPCEDLVALRLPHTEITAATAIASGAFAPPPGAIGGAGVAAAYAGLPAFCRVQATLRPTSDSDIRIEVWLPAENWNGHLQAVGNGAFMSGIFYGSLAAAVKDGYAGTATNTGKEGNGGDTLIGRPEKVIDWGYRAVHEMTVAAKAIVAARYGNAVKHSYWNACSTGGRQGLVAAEYFPDDFDGIAAGDAANPMTRNQASTLYSTLAVNKDAAGFITREKWAAYRAAVKDRCDAADGVKDGLLNDPLSCRFDPKELLCSKGDADSCLTAPQVAAMNTVLAGMKNPRTGESLHPGWPVGAAPGNSIVGREPEQVAVDTFRVLFNRPDWDYRAMNFDTDIALADRLGRSLMDASDPSRLKAFLARGGKLLLYHGWNDSNISPLLGLDYYNKAVAANGGKRATYDSIRMFMVPGMGHCQGGEGPNVFDKMTVITRWVEQGQAPDSIVAAHSADGKVDRTRPLCPYPQLAKYKGSGSTDEAASFACAAP